MTISRILLPLLVLPFLSLFAENGIYHGKTYQLDYSRSIRISILQKNGTFTPFLKESVLYRNGVREKNSFVPRNSMPVFRRKTGIRTKSNSSIVSADLSRNASSSKGGMEAHPEWLRIHFSGEFREHKKQDGGMRMLIFLRGTGTASAFIPRGQRSEGGSCGIKAEFKPKLSLAFSAQPEKQRGNSLLENRKWEIPSVAGSGTHPVLRKQTALRYFFRTGNRCRTPFPPLLQHSAGGGCDGSGTADPQSVPPKHWIRKANWKSPTHGTGESNNAYFRSGRMRHPSPDRLFLFQPADWDILK